MWRTLSAKCYVQVQFSTIETVDENRAKGKQIMELH
jgi:hypothetical protein